PVPQGHSETSDANSCQERIDQVLGEHVADLFCPPYPSRRNNGVNRRGLAYRIVWQWALSSAGRVIICREMPFSKCQRLAGCAIAPHGVAFEIWRAAKDCSDWIIVD